MESTSGDNKEKSGPDISLEVYDGVCSLEDEEPVPTSNSITLGKEEQQTGATCHRVHWTTVMEEMPYVAKVFRMDADDDDDDGYASDVED
ncbi:hypothetical protein LSAT2_008497 [Lamellibrachia satsuma]|nr:hypothetical protein LSAT2_008497 [Lamellibrachia satsuma]